MDLYIHNAIAKLSSCISHEAPASANPSLSNQYDTVKDEIKFLERVHSFLPAEWFGYPIWLSPVRCASHGWRSVGGGILECQSCHNKIGGHMDPNLDISATRLTYERLEVLLIAGHNAWCIWKSCKVSENFLQVNVSSEVQFKFMDRLKSLFKIVTVAPLISNEFILDLDEDRSRLILNYVTKLNTQNICCRNLLSLISLALCGWSLSETNDNQLVCLFCNRSLGLWNYLTQSDQLFEKKDDGISNKKFKKDINVKVNSDKLVYNNLFEMASEVCLESSTEAFLDNEFSKCNDLNRDNANQSRDKFGNNLNKLTDKGDNATLSFNRKAIINDIFNAINIISDNINDPSSEFNSQNNLNDKLDVYLQKYLGELDEDSSLSLPSEVKNACDEYISILQDIIPLDVYIKNSNNIVAIDDHINNDLIKDVNNFSQAEISASPLVAPVDNRQENIEEKNTFDTSKNHFNENIAIEASVNISYENILNTPSIVSVNNCDDITNIVTSLNDFNKDVPIDVDINNTNKEIGNVQLNVEFDNSGNNCPSIECINMELAKEVGLNPQDSEIIPLEVAVNKLKRHLDELHDKLQNEYKKRKFETFEKTALHPISEHHPWCVWVGRVIQPNGSRVSINIEKSHDDSVDAELCHIGSHGKKSTAGNMDISKSSGFKDSNTNSNGEEMVPYLQLLQHIFYPVDLTKLKNEERIMEVYRVKNLLKL